MAIHIFRAARLCSAFLAGYIVGGLLRVLFL
jgi:hypothetical protein